MDTTTSESVCPAVLFLVFNRPETTLRVFEAIRAARPSRLYVAADGARQGKDGEQQAVNEVRMIASKIDWPCKVQTLFRDTNLGCKLAVSSAIDWFFYNEEEGIVLEDDCLPSPIFFNYCAQLLERYRNDERIGVITGSSLCNLRKNRMSWGEEDYIFARYVSIWGWASWRRVWNDYDVSMLEWGERKKDILSVIHNQKMVKLNENTLEEVYKGKIDTWDYQVSYMLWRTNRLAIVPIDNLVENIGFGPGATHTKNKNSAIVKMTAMGNQEFSNVLKCPSCMLPNQSYQKYIESFSTRPFFVKVLEATWNRVSSLFVRN